MNLNFDTLLSSNTSLDQLSDMIISCRSVVTSNAIDLMKSDMKLELPRFNGSKLPSAQSTKYVFLTGILIPIILMIISAKSKHILF